MVVLFVAGVWLVGELIGFEISLVSTLVASVVLTVIGNLIMLGIGKVRTA
jgi:hypothetical protein